MSPAVKSEGSRVELAFGNQGNPAEHRYSTTILLSRLGENARLTFSLRQKEVTQDALGFTSGVRWLNFELSYTTHRVTTPCKSISYSMPITGGRV
jgi:hypothetical protein